MKKSALVAVLCILFSISYGQQFNDTYYLADTSILSKQVELSTDKVNIYFSAPVIYQKHQKLMLSKTDGAGKPLKSVMIDTPFYDHRIISTRDTGLLLAARMDTCLYVLKYDKNLVRQWAYKYPVGAHPYLSPGSNYSVGIDKYYVDTLATEYFYINCASATSEAGYVNTDGAFSVIKITQTGTLKFNRKFSPSNRSNLGPTAVRDDVHCIKLLDTSGTRFGVAGHHVDLDTTGAMTGRRLFFIEISDKATILQQYKMVSTAGAYPSDPEIAWDRVSNRIACTYKESISGNPLITGAIGLIAMNINLTPFAGRNYFHDNLSWGNHITVNGNNDYVISVYADSNNTANPAILKVSGSSLSPVFYTKYNVNHNVLNYSYHFTDQADNNYLLPYVPQNIFTNACRMIKTDVNGNSCGVRYYSIDTAAYTPTTAQRTYHSVTNTTRYSFTPIEYVVSLTYDSCTSPAWNSYRTVQMADQVNTSASIVPTAAANNEELKCTVQCPAKSEVMISVCDMTGRRIFDRSFNANKEENIFMIPTDRFNPGLHIARVTVNGQVITTTKIVVTR